MTVDEVLSALKQKGSQRNVEGMERFGIHNANAFGVPTPAMKAIAKKIGTDHALAVALWETGYYEARIIACFVVDPAQVTKKLINTWVRQIDNWAICDTLCGCVFDRTPLAEAMIAKWTHDQREFVKRAGFVTIAWMAVHRKELPDSSFLPYLDTLYEGSTDERNFVKKAVNWALRQIGKRSLELNAAAIETGEKIRAQHSSCAKWIAADALRELRSDAVQKRLREKAIRLKQKQKR